MKKDCDKKENIKKITLHRQAKGGWNGWGVHFSSNVNETIRAI